ncbi:MAG: hypothetical protein WA435_09765 [Gallionellaceae bacterium]
MVDNNPNVVNIVPVEQEPVKPMRASLYGSKDPLPEKFVELIHKLEIEINMPIWMIIQNDDSEWGEISDKVYDAFHAVKAQIEEKKPVGLLLHSPGGQAEEAYKIVRLFQRRTDKLTMIVPFYAKSAATLMAVGGNEILMGREAELGPLDVQIFNDEDNEYKSALNAVQALERLNAYALSALDQFMLLLAARTNKKVDALVALASQYATSMVKPLMEKIDSVNLTEKSRALKVAEDYAVRLMKEAGYSFASAKRIASTLVERYSTHGFVIGRSEALAFEDGLDYGLGLKIAETKSSTEQIFDSLLPHLKELTVIGNLEEIAA